MTALQFNFIRIDQSISENKLAKVFYKSYRRPSFGIFVKLEDAEELKAKGFARFVSQGKIETFDYIDTMFKYSQTIMLKVDDIKLMELFTKENASI